MGATSGTAGNKAVQALGVEGGERAMASASNANASSLPASQKHGYRSYVDVDTIPLTNTGLVSNGLCAGLVMHYTRVGKAGTWKQGEAVRGNASIKKGTAIATFANGIYPNLAHGNHAALYVSQDATGIWVVDQWAELTKPHKRKLLFLGKNSDGTYVDPSNNGDAFSIIEH